MKPVTAVIAVWADHAFLFLHGDADGDGIRSRAEACVSDTAWDLGDTDGGGTSDGTEISNLTDPLDAADD